MLKMAVIFVMWASLLAMILIAMDYRNKATVQAPVVECECKPGLAEQAAAKNAEHAERIRDFEKLTKTERSGK